MCQGAFGVVSLVREKSTGNLYAMKQVADSSSIVTADVMSDLIAA